ncbi:DNA polymerase subunit Cdc27 [Leptodontidium sp. 2 PMI_412]|nr:DNA polymerase subunit Cdc27 [Leptodontidium sp. 2 PMI_412]
MADYRNFLATNILTEDKVVTYRLLSRTLKIHVNDAKEMLYDFHRQQNAKKPGTIHATYLISGTKGKEEPLATNGAAKKDGEDDYMQSSPFMASSMPAAEGTGESGVLSITLVKEENLEEVRSQYEHISSIHVYSIGPHPLKDLQILSDITREIQVLCASEDAVESAPKYGTILNKNVKRRPARRPPPVAAAPVPGPAKAAVKPKLAEAKEAVKPTIKQETKPSQPSTANEFFGKGKAKAKPAASSNPSSKESTPNPPTLKHDSSSIFKSFAKAKPKLKREGTDSSAVESPAMSAAEDSPMKDVVSDDEEDTYAPPPPSKEIVDSDRKSRKEREAALKKMMEDEDEDEVVVKPKPKRKEKEIVDKEEIPITVSGGRRRGRRRVMKKKTVKDDEGYLVTKEEPVWESFSEDEPVEKPKPKAQASNTTAKTKKSAAKAGQGNIMSFFGKK